MMLTYQQKVDAVIEYLKLRDTNLAKYLNELEKTPTNEPANDIDPIVRKVVLDSGIEPDLIGFENIVVALTLIYKNHDYLRNVSKTLYPEVARIRGISEKAVDRSIRHACDSVGFTSKRYLARMMMVIIDIAG